MAGRIAKPKPTKTLEQRLWDAVDMVRVKQEPSEYKHVLLEQAGVSARMETV